MSVATVDAVGAGTVTRSRAFAVAGLVAAALVLIRIDGVALGAYWIEILLLALAGTVARRTPVIAALLLFIVVVLTTGLVGWFAGLLGQATIVRYWPSIQAGLRLTLFLVVVSVTLGAILALPIALGRLSASRWLRWPAIAYITFFRGTPLLVQTYFVYYGAGQFSSTLSALSVPVLDIGLDWSLLAVPVAGHTVGIGLPNLPTFGIGALAPWSFFRDSVFCVLLTFTLNTAAYQAEILRGAIMAVPRGQSEAARALGLSRAATFRTVVFPQAMRISLRPLGNEIILMIKGSSVASVFTVFELLGSTRLAFSRSFDLTVYLWAAALYLLLVETLRRAWDVIERRWSRHLVR